MWCGASDRNCHLVSSGSTLGYDPSASSDHHGISHMSGKGIPVTWLCICLEEHNDAEL